MVSNSVSSSESYGMLNRYLESVMDFMSTHKVKLNPNKMEVLLVEAYIQSMFQTRRKALQHFAFMVTGNQKWYPQENQPAISDLCCEVQLEGASREASFMVTFPMDHLASAATPK